MTVLSHGLTWIDLEFLGRGSAIATAVIHAPGGVALVDPGPTTCLDALERGLQRQGIRLTDVRQILLTHIHLDHAGATGTLVRRYPDLTVYVHERGAPHVVDPTKLLDSATRLYGADMDRLWGEVAAVPPSNLVVLRGSERIEAAGRTFDVAYTPGHASHHVSYYDASSGVAFVGDTAGICINGGYVLPPTPPPDIDLEAWRSSAALIDGWSPDTLFLTHFGPVGHPRPHLQSLLEHLEELAGWVRTSLAEPGTDEERSTRFAGKVRHHMAQRMTETEAAAYRVAAPTEQLWFGLARYWRKRGMA